MKIVVLVKHVPDTDTVIKLGGNSKSLDTSDYKFTINPCDDYAVEEAIRTQEKYPGESVIVSLGAANSQETMRRALAMGIDRGIWINSEGVSPDCLDSFSVAQALSQVIRDEAPDVVYCGLNTTDEGAGNVGPMVAEMNQMPCLINVSKIEWLESGKMVRVCRDAEAGIVEVYEAQLPVVIAPHQSLNEPRYPSLPGIMKAKKKPLVEKKLENLSMPDPKVEIIKYELPQEKVPGKIFKGKPVTEMVKEVVELLRNEAKVI